MAEKQEIARWNPFADLEGRVPFGAFRDFPRLARVFDDMLAAQNGGAPARFALDVTESDREYADLDQIRAAFEDGILRLEIARRPEAKAKTIAIKG